MVDKNINFFDPITELECKFIWERDKGITLVKAGDIWSTINELKSNDPKKRVMTSIDLCRFHSIAPFAITQIFEYTKNAIEPVIRCNAIIIAWNHRKLDFIFEMLDDAHYCVRATAAYVLRQILKKDMLREELIEPMCSYPEVKILLKKKCVAEKVPFTKKHLKLTLRAVEASIPLSQKESLGLYLHQIQVASFPEHLFDCPNLEDKELKQKIKNILNCLKKSLKFYDQKGNIVLANALLTSIQKEEYARNKKLYSLSNVTNCYNLLHIYYLNLQMVKDLYINIPEKTEAEKREQYLIKLLQKYKNKDHVIINEIKRLKKEIVLIIKNKKLKAKGRILCPIHHTVMKEAEIVWGYPAEIKDNLIYGGCDMAANLFWKLTYGESLDSGYICMHCLKKYGSSGQHHAYLLRLGEVVPFNQRNKTI